MNKINSILKLDNKGFTLIEVLAVVAIITILGLLVVPNTLNIINKGKDTTYNILVKDITIASKLLFEELEYSNNELYHYYLKEGKTDKLINIETLEEDKSININLQTLVSNGLLKGTNNTSNNSNNINDKVLNNPRTKVDIGDCQITIIKMVDNNYNTSYKIINNSTSNTNCPSDLEYQEVLN